MLPSFEQIRREAFFRWQRRGGEHGHDREDWTAAEQELLFTLNYEVAAHYLLDGHAPRAVGEAGRRVCRFCELTEPAASFSKGRRALPDLPGLAENQALLTYEECDECHEQFRAGVDRDLARFLAGWPAGDRPAPDAIPLAAFKGLVRLALAVMPRGDLPGFEGAVEWVGNPDHDCDARLFAGLGCDLYDLAEPPPHPWIALARRADDDAPVASMLFSLSLSRFALQLAIPLAEHDDDLDAAALAVPRTCAPFAAGLGVVFPVPRFLPLALDPG